MSENSQPILQNPDYNPMPEPETIGYVTTPDGVRLRYARWKAAKAPIKGTILFLQGRTEYIEKGYETINDLISKGFEVLAFDWRGQGGSDRLLEDPRKGYVDNFDDYVTDIEAIISDVALPDCRAPLFILAHSTGSLVALLAAPRIKNKIKRMVLCSPLIGLGPQIVSEGMVGLFSGGLTALGLGDLYLGGGGTPSENRAFTANIVTSDTSRYERNQKFVEEFRDLSIGGPTASWVHAATHAMKQLANPDFYQDITTPILFLLAGNDRVVNNEAAENLAIRLRSGSSLTIDGAKHELMQERDAFREQMLAAVFSFIPGS